MKKNFYRKSKCWIAIITSAILLFTASVPPQGEAKTVNEKVEKTEHVNVSEKFYYVCAPATIPEELCDDEDSTAIISEAEATPDELCEPQGAREELCTQKNDAYRNSLASYICHVNNSIGEDAATELVDSIIESSEKYDVDETLVMAIAQTESCYESDAVSSVGCKGVMQTSDVLAEEAGYDGSQLFDPEVSIDVGTSYIKDKLDEFGDVALALTAYNQGAGTVYSGNYDLGYADLTISRIDEIEEYIDGH